MDAELTCKEFVELVTAYLEAALDPELEQRVVEHLGECDGCTSYLAQIRQTVRVLRLIGESPTLLSNKDELLALFRRRLDA